jgi:endonuclease III
MGPMTQPSPTSDTAFEREPRRFAEIVSRLADQYGHRTWRSHGRPLDELIATVLSQHTSDLNTARAFASLRSSFPDWRSVVDAPTPVVADAIRCGGLADTKAPRIQSILRAIEAETGELTLDWITALTLEESRAWLISLPGVGPKTASCVLLFSLGLPAMPVDTHVYRVSRRLGLVGDRVPAANAHEPLERAIGPDRDAVYALHLNLISHGRSVCRARTPSCARCVLADLCPAAQSFVAPQLEGRGSDK